MTDLRIEIRDASAVGEARRAAAELARSIGFADTEVGRLSLIVTEAATNVVKHVGEGELILHVLRAPARGIAAVVLDRGPGIRDMGEALRDGFSSAGTPGNGLGAITRLASDFDVYSRPAGGTAIFGCVWRDSAPPASALLAGAVNVPHPSETVSGDAWAISREGSRTLVLVADGLGHGVLANEAAQVAVDAFRGRTLGSPGDMLDHIHHALRATRGAAIAVAEIDSQAKLVRFAGLGNIAGTIVSNGSTRSVVSQHGTAGHDARRIQEYAYPWSENAAMVLHSDGLVSRWTVDAYPGLFSRHPMLAAGILYRDFRRGRDDTTVVVLREAV